MLAALVVLQSCTSGGVSGSAGPESSRSDDTVATPSVQQTTALSAEALTTSTQSGSGEVHDSTVLSTTPAPSSMSAPVSSTEVVLPEIENPCPDCSVLSDAMVGADHLRLIGDPGAEGVTIWLTRSDPADRVIAAVQIAASGIPSQVSCAGELCVVTLSSRAWKGGSVRVVVADSRSLAVVGEPTPSATVPLVVGGTNPLTVVTGEVLPWKPGQEQQGLLQAVSHSVTRDGLLRGGCSLTTAPFPTGALTGPCVAIADAPSFKAPRADHLAWKSPSGNINCADHSGGDVACIIFDYSFDLGCSLPAGAFFDEAGNVGSACWSDPLIDGYQTGYVGILEYGHTMVVGGVYDTRCSSLETGMNCVASSQFTLSKTGILTG